MVSGRQQLLLLNAQQIAIALRTLIRESTKQPKDYYCLATSIFFHKQHLKEKKKKVCCEEMTKRLSCSSALGTRLSNFYVRGK